MKVWAAAAFVVAVGAVAIARLAFLVVRVDGTSMTPTFPPGESVLAVRRFLRRRVRPHDIVV